MALCISVKPIYFAIVAVLDLVDALVADDFFEHAVHQALVEGVGVPPQVV